MKMITGEGALLKNGELIAIVQYHLTFKEEFNKSTIEKGVLYFPGEAMTDNMLKHSLVGQYDLQVEHHGTVEINIQETPTPRKRMVKILTSV